MVILSTIMYTESFAHTVSVRLAESMNPETLNNQTGLNHTYPKGLLT